MNYNDNGTIKQITVKAGDTLPVGTEVDVPDGTTIPAGWEEVDDPQEYSTDEKVIGKWIDNKPLYRKVIQTTTSDTANTERRTIIDYSIINIVKLDGRVEFATNSTLPLNTYTDTSSYVHTYTNVYNGNTRVITSTPYISKPITYIVEYTKTTD